MYSFWFCKNGSIADVLNWRDLVAVKFRYIFNCPWEPVVKSLPTSFLTLPFYLGCTPLPTLPLKELKEIAAIRS
jgi:hypothetical protein